MTCSGDKPPQPALAPSSGKPAQDPLARCQIAAPHRLDMEPPSLLLPTSTDFAICFDDTNLETRAAFICTLIARHHLETLHEKKPIDGPADQETQKRPTASQEILCRR